MLPQVGDTEAFRVLTFAAVLESVNSAYTCVGDKFSENHDMTDMFLGREDKFAWFS